MRRRWTVDEEELLLKYIDNGMSMAYIAKRLKRSISSVVSKVERMGHSSKYCGDKIYFYQIITAMGFSNNYMYLLDKWIRMGLEIKDQKIREISYKVVDLKHFWKWAYEHRDNLDFRNMEPYALGCEPDWVKSKIKADQRRVVKYNFKKFYTPDEEALLIQYAKRGLTLIQIAERMERSQKSIEGKLCRMGMKYRTATEAKRYWNDEEIHIMLKVMEAGGSIEDVSVQLGRSARSVHMKYGRVKKAMDES